VRSPTFRISHLSPIMSEHTQSSSRIPVVPKHFLGAFILTTTCFSLWGFANDYTNPLVKAFKEIFLISNAQSSLVQFAFYGGYFTMALPAAFFIRKFSYKAAIIVGFCMYAIGALLSIPASITANFTFFLIGFWVLTFGLAFLETSCNPYILAMGPRETATQRLNLAQAFNPIGSLTGMAVATFILAPNLQIGEFRTELGENKPEYVQYLDPADFDGEIPTFENELPGVLDGAVPKALEGFREQDPAGFLSLQEHDLGVVRGPYVAIAVIVLIVMCVFIFSKLPSFHDDNKSSVGDSFRRLFGSRRWREGVLAQAFYVGAQITCWTFIIHYGMAEVGLTLGQSQGWNIAAMLIFLSSRFICTFMLKYISPGKLLCFLAIGAGLLTLGAIFLTGYPGLVSLVLISACMSLMFPTIYGIALGNLDEDDCQLGSAGLVMAIVGGAVLPLLQGKLIDDASVRTSFYLPFICFVVIGIYGLRTWKIFESGTTGHTTHEI
jgi:FHS family L-fucose permease-like MFS transporter